MGVDVERRGRVAVVAIDRPEARNAVDRPTAEALLEAFLAVDADDAVDVAVLTGRGGTFCAGADLKAVATDRGNRVTTLPAEEIVGSPGPMGPTRLRPSKPVIAAVEGWAVAGGLELACWADLRVAGRDARFGVLCRRWGVPLVDGGTVRLPRLIGASRAMDLILTGREVDAEEAAAMGLVNRVVDPGDALDAAVELGEALSRFPQRCLRSDLRSAHDQWGLDEASALAREVELGWATIASGETQAGAARFAQGHGRHGDPTDL